MTALELLSGDAAAFLAKTWASAIHVHRADPADLGALLSLDDVDHLLTGTAIRTPSVRLVRDGTVLPASAYTRSATLAGQPLTGLVDGRRVLAEFDAGATVVLQGLHRSWEPLTRAVAELERALGHPCQANAYLTPPSAQGFARHSDSHDVFVFQTHGSKLWQVGEADVNEPGERGQRGERDEREVLLEPGVSMYLPTGTPHAARARESVSLHVTIGVNRVTWREVLERALRHAVADAADDGPVPAGYLDDPGLLAEGLRERLGPVVASLSGIRAEDVAAAEVERFLTHRPSRLSGGLRDRAELADPEGLGDQTVLRRRSGHVCELAAGAGAGRLRVLLGDRDLDVPAYLRPALAHVRKADTLRPADLDAAGLDPQSRLVLCRRLVLEGLLEVAGE